MLGFFNERKLVIETRKAVFSQPDVLRLGEGGVPQRRRQAFGGRWIAIGIHHPPRRIDAEYQCLINHKCVCGALTRHFCQTRVMGSGILWSKVCRVKFALSPVRWLASSFYFFCVDLCVGKKIKCACNCVGCMSAVSCHYATFRLYKCC